MAPAGAVLTIRSCVELKGVLARSRRSGGRQIAGLLADPVARPYARMWLESNGREVPDSYRHEGDDALLFVETAGLILDHAGADELVAQLPREGQDQQVDLVRQLWRVESPFTEPVLQALATAAPPSLSKAARKALFSFRSAGKG